MSPRSLNPFGGCAIVLISIATACSSPTAPEEDGAGGSTSSVSKGEGGDSGKNVDGAGGAKSGSGGDISTGGGTSNGGATAAGGTKGNAGTSTRGGGGSAEPSSGAGGKGWVGTGGAAGRAGKGGAGPGGTTNGAGGKDPAGTGGRGGKGGDPDSGAPGAGGSSQGVGGSNTDGGSTGGGKSAGCGKTPTISSSQYNKGQPISITVGGKERRYVLNVPTNYDNTKPYTLIVTIHQLDGNDKQMYNWQYYGLLPLSNNNVIFAAPNGQKNGSPCSGTGDGDSGCGWPNTSGQDLALVDAVVAQVEENFCVDTNHIFATGWSYGASMSYEVGCERPLGGTKAPWGVRAIAIYSGRQMSGSCKPSMPVAFYAAHGTNDTVLNYDSGLTLAQNFAKANGCTWATPGKASGAHVCTNVTGCKDGYPTEFCSFVGGHTPFPDNGQSQGSWGPQEAWKFLSQF